MPRRRLLPSVNFFCIPTTRRSNAILSRCLHQLSRLYEPISMATISSGCAYVQPDLKRQWAGRYSFEQMPSQTLQHTFLSFGEREGDLHHARQALCLFSVMPPGAECQDQAKRSTKKEAKICPFTPNPRPSSPNVAAQLEVTSVIIAIVGPVNKKSVEL